MAIIRPLRFIRPLFLPRDKNNAEFWLSHGLIIGSTVLGVYLAAAAGYRVGMELQTMRDDLESYHVQLALLAEVTDNLEQVEGWVDRLPGRRSMFTNRAEQYRLETYIWQAMATSDAAFQVPPEALTGIRRLYRQLSGELNRLTDDNPNTEPDLIRMRNDLEEARQTVLPALTNSINRLRLQLEQVENARRIANVGR